MLAGAVCAKAIFRRDGDTDARERRFPAMRLTALPRRGSMIPR